MTGSLWTSGEIARATGGTASAEFEVTGVAFDSREIAGGDLFIAMRGEATDGHKFIDQAIAAGAAAILCEKPVDHPHVLVADSARALEALGRAARDRSDAQIIGVTGSAGKTGTKEALFAALDRASFGHAHRSVKSYNNHVGVPLSLARMPRDALFGVFEMGMNHAGELAALTRIVRPHVAIITTIGPAHVGNFADGERGVANAKAEIFEGLEEGGTAIIPADNLHFPALDAAARRATPNVVTFGRSRDASLRLLDAVGAPEGGSLVTVDLGERRLCYTVASPGDHWVMNSLAVLAAVRAVGADLAVAGLALADMPGMAGRGERHMIATVDGGEALVIDESYNANPASMRVTIESLGLQPAARHIVVLGAMLELGAGGPAYHAELAMPIAKAGVALAILVGEETRILAETLTKSLEKPIETLHVADAAGALDALSTRLRAGDAVLVKGSNAIGLSKLVQQLINGSGGQPSQGAAANGSTAMTVIGAMGRQ